MNRPNTIGLIGNDASGKDSVARILETKGYRVISVCDILRERITELGYTTSRQLQTLIVNQLRSENDDDLVKLNNDIDKIIKEI